MVSQALTPPRVVLVAGPGYGKTTLLHRLRPGDGVVVSATDRSSVGQLPPGVWVGVDDLDMLTPPEQALILDTLTADPQRGFAVASRTAPVSTATRRWSGVSERGAGDLALAPFQIADTLARDYAIAEPDVALRVADLTLGWPTLVHHAGDTLSRDPHADLCHELTSQQARTARWLWEQLLADLPEAGIVTLGALSPIDPLAPVTAAVWAAAARVIDPHGSAAGLVARLRELGVLRPRRLLDGADDPVLVPVVAAVVAGSGVATDRQVAAVAAAVGAVHEHAGAWLAASRAFALAQRREDVRRLVSTRGEDILAAGGAPGLVTLLEQVLGDTAPDPAEGLQRTYADALRKAGDPTSALQAFAPISARSAESGWQPGDVARLAAVHVQLGQYEQALEVLDRWPAPGPAPRGPDPQQTGHPDGDADESVVEWLAARTHVLVMLGREVEAEPVAARGLAAAEVLGQPRLLGEAHLAMSRTVRGVRRELHQSAAIRWSTQAGDVVTTARALVARTNLLLAEAQYQQARRAGAEALRLARLCSPPGLLAAALHNLGEALARIGELDEARWHLDCAVAVCRRLGPARAALGLVGVAAVLRDLGHTERALLAYREAIDLARGSGDVQVLVPAWSGTAELIRAVAPAEAAEAWTAANQALDLAPPALSPVPLTALARLALADADRAGAAAYASRAVAAARQCRASDFLAEALEVAGVAATEPTVARVALQEALSIWEAGGARLAAQRVHLALGRLPDADSAQRARAREAARALRDKGVQLVHGRPVDAARGPAVEIQVLGEFSVSVDGATVPLPAWRSRQARSLVKILVAHQGQVISRERLCDLLWPDEDPAKTGHRLSVLLATVRRVLDPGRAWSPDQFIVADQHGLRLDGSTTAVDAVLLLRDAAHAAQLMEAEALDAADEVLEHVVARYRGPAFADEPDELWADALREQVRAAWLRSLRRLVVLRRRAGRRADMIELLVRLLAADPYDEQVHHRLVSALVAGGRHGEARRAFDRWRAAMADIGAPSPDPAILGAAAGRTPVLTSR